MKISKKIIHQTHTPVGADFFDRLWVKSWTYIKTVVDVVREPVLILDKDLRVIAANDPFFRTFQVEAEDTVNKVIYELGNGQWNIPALKNLIEDILPKHTFFKGFEVDHEFPVIGRKVMILNARQIHFKDRDSHLFPAIILLAIEDVTEMMGVAELIAHHTNQFEIQMNQRTKNLEDRNEKLEEQIKQLSKVKK